MSISMLAKRAAKLAIDNSPAILTSIGVIGTVTTAYLVGKASFEASDIIRLQEADEEDRGMMRLDEDYRVVLKKRVELVWRLYIPAVTTGALTVACIVSANRVGARRAAGLAAAYSISEKAFDEYKAKVVEKLGERKEEAVRTDIAQDRLNRYTVDDVELIGAEVGHLCYDKYADRMFRSTVEALRSAQNDFNHAMIHDGYMSLADFYRMLDLKAPTYSENVGWNSDRLMELSITTVMAAGDQPCLAMDFKHEPRPDYGRFH